MSAVSFTIEATSSTSEARRGTLRTAHGLIPTPVFMPVGTLGLVKSLDHRDLAELGAGLCLANAYHLMLRPGDAEVHAMGGLHAFTGHTGALLSDSGGFQVYSLANMRKVTDDGVVFRAHTDGTLHNLTPERLVEVQENLGPDIAMVLDECPPANASREVVGTASDRTTAWAGRALAARNPAGPAWFGIVQGALFEDLRAAHAQCIGAMDFDGFAIGGVSVGEDPEDIARIVHFTAPLLPRDKPRYLMGVGTPADLVRGVAAGVDMFDCVMPSRNARNGSLFTSTGKLGIKNAANRGDDAPIDEACACYTCRTFSRGFMRHLFVSKELSYHRLATLHNLHFYMQLMARMRQAIAADTFSPKAMLAELDV